MDRKIHQQNFIRRRNKKLITVIESNNNKKIKISYNRANSENTNKNKSRKLLMKSFGAIELITKGPSINKLFFKNDNISLKSESVPKSNKKYVKKYKSINIDKGKNEIYNNIKLQNQNDLNIKLSNNTLSNLNMDAVEKSQELKGSPKDFYPFAYNQTENYLKKSRKPNFINKNCISNDKLIIYNNNNQMKPNPIIEFYKPLKDNEIKKNAIQKFQSVHEKKFSKFSDLRVQKQLKEEDMNGSLDNINPAEFREGKTNIELISDNSIDDNNVSSSLSSNEDEQNNETKNRRHKIKKEGKIINSNSLNSQGMAKIEKLSNKNYYYNNNDLDENYFKNDIAFFRSPQIYSNRTSNKSLMSDPKGDLINNFMLSVNDSNIYNIDNFNKNYGLENMLNKSIIKKLGSLNSNPDFDKENEDENELNEKLNKSNNYIDNSKNLDNLNIQEQILNLKINEQNKNNFIKGNIQNIKNTNFMNENTNIINNIQKNQKYNEQINNNINNYSQKNSFDFGRVGNNPQNIKTINIINNNINNPNLNNNVIPFNNLIGSPNQSNIINIQNMNNYNNNNFILNPNQINPNNNSNNNLIFDYNSNISQNTSLSESSPYMYRKNNIFDFNSNNQDNMIQNIYEYINNNNQMNNFGLNQLNQQNYLINQRNNIDYMNDIYQNKSFVNNQKQIQYNAIINNKMNNLYKSNNIYNRKNSNDNPYTNNNLNQNYPNFNNLNIINQNNNNIYQQNIQYNNNPQIKKKNKSNYLQKNNLKNQNNINISNNQNYIINNQNNNYNYLNKNMNQKLININNNNNDYNNLIIPNNNINYYQNLNNPNFYQNIKNNQNLNYYQIINGIPYLNNNNNNYNGNISINNNNQNKKIDLNKQRKQNYNLLSNEDLAKQAFNIAKNQNGCRYLQKRVENNKELVPTLFFPNILGHFQALSNDQFGNYYIKIIIKYLPNDMIYKLISLMHPYFGNIGTNQYGTKVMQYLIEFLNNESNLHFFVEKIIPHIVNLINDLNGIHIIEKLILIKSKCIQLIFNTISNNIEQIAITREGSIFIIKKLFDLLDENNLIFLLNSINQKLDKIITNQYGNYLIQNIISKFNIMLKYQIIENIIKNIVKYSIQKFSSNVVEKCFDTELCGNVIDEILKDNNFETILLNDYGNYVIQKALNKADKNKQNSLLKALVPLVDKLQKKPFGQKLLQKLFISYPKLSIYILNC